MAAVPWKPQPRGSCTVSVHEASLLRCHGFDCHEARDLPGKPVACNPGHIVLIMAYFNV